MNSISVSNFKPPSAKFQALLKDVVLIDNQRQLYLELRSRRGRQPFSYSELGRKLGISSRALVQSSLDALAKVGLLVKTTEPNANVWTVRSITSDMPALQGFRGHSQLLVRSGTSGLPHSLSDHENEQLFGAFAAEPAVAGVYRFLRTRVGGQFTKTEAAQLFQTEQRTLNRRIARLAELGLVSEMTQEGIVLVHFAECGLADAVDPVVLHDWLKADAAVPRWFSVSQALLARRSQSADQQLIVDFYGKCMDARAAITPSKVKLGAVEKTANERVARSLANGQSFTGLMPVLLFFCLEFRSDNVEEYGRSLMTFQRNLAAVTEELDDHLATDRNYVHRTMKQYGLDKFFPTPDFVDPKALDPRFVARKARQDLEHMQAMGWSDEEIAQHAIDEVETKKRYAAWLAERTKPRPILALDPDVDDDDDDNDEDLRFLDDA